MNGLGFCEFALCQIRANFKSKLKPKTLTNIGTTSGAGQDYSPPITIY